MVSEKPPTAILFDIGGVCVLSPLEAIEKFEHENNIPPNWINFAISRNPVNGHWQRLERGEIQLDDDFFKGFREDLSNESSWREFHAQFTNKSKGQRRLKDIAAVANPSQLGDPVSLKAETADSSPTDEDRGAAAAFVKKAQTEDQSEGTMRTDEEKPKLSKLAKDTTIGDPTSLEAEAVVVSSQQNVNHETAAATSQSTAPTSDDPIPANFSQSTKTQSSPPPSQTGQQLPPIPSIDVSSLFWSMMSHARNPDPYIFPALQRLSSLPSHKRPLLAALSNTITFPPSHPFSSSSSPPPSSPPSSSSPIPDFLRLYFDLVIASSEIGMRKPEPRIYELTIQRLDAFDRKHGGRGINARDILFLDDIGENLKAAAAVKGGGMRTLKVVRGKTWRAVKELERVLGGVELMDEKTRRAKL